MHPEAGICMNSQVGHSVLPRMWALKPNGTLQGDSTSLCHNLPLLDITRVQCWERTAGVSRVLGMVGAAQS